MGKNLSTIGSKMVISSLFLSLMTLLAVSNGLLASSSRSSSIIRGVGQKSNKKSHVESTQQLVNRIRGGVGNNGIRNRKPWLLSQHQHDAVSDSSATTATATDSKSDSNSDSSQYIPNIFSKEDEEISFIHEVLIASFLFQDFSSIYGKEGSSNKKNKENPSLTEVVKSFEKYTYKKGTMLCEQGDTTDTDYLYLIASGSCSVSIDMKQLPDPYGTMGEGSLIGDLAMLYGTARAATIRCQTPVTVYRLHRSDFYHFLDFDKDATSSSTSTTSTRHEEIQQQVKEIDEVIDQISGVKSKYDGDIIRQFQPERRWLWSLWKGTILQHAWKSAVVNMAVSILFVTTIRLANHYIFNNPLHWPVGAIPDKTHPFVIRTQGLYKLWAYTMSITTFVLTFFLSQAYSLWRDIYTKGRKIQGRLNDISLMLACSVERNPKTGLYTNRGKTFLNDIAGSSRLCHAFSWAGFVRKFNVLLTPRGLSRMLSRDVMNRSQYDTLVGIRPNACGPQHVTLMWIMAQIFQGMREGIIPGDTATRSMLISKVSDLRGTLGGVGDSLDGRIPIAYAHFVQLIVDIFLALAPFALYSELGLWSVPAVGILNIFYSGMLDLAKILLDPLDNSDFYKNSMVNMDIGVLIRESNAGSNRWKAGLEKLPFKYSN